ncbi:MAG: lysophospholipid acyltransferase family protein [Spirochaetales bacterium]|nr:lysophospholipid acyltransferase family protein [Spirochaetales bacterium]
MREKGRIKEVNPGIVKLLRRIFNFYFKYKFNIKTILPPEVAEIEGSFIILPNHQGFWDPFFIGISLPQVPYFVTSDAVYRSKIFGFFMRKFGTIPKTKSQSDIDAIKNIMEMKKMGRCVGIFSEGQRTWDGCTLPVIKSTAKLVRLMKLPVVTVVFKGGYLSQPRWRKSISQGELEIEYKLLYKGDEVSKKRISEIYQDLTEALSHDEIEYQKERKIEWKNNKAAENIEQFLFVCPECGSFEGFSSSGVKFKCQNCNSEWSFDKYQQIIPESSQKTFSNVRDWDHWQLEQMKEQIDNLFHDGKQIFSDSDVVFQTGFKSKRLKFLAKGTIKMEDKSLIFEGKNGKILKKMDLSKIVGINVQNHEVLDFYYDNVLYTVNNPKKHFSAYKWWRAIDYIQKDILKLNLPE